MKLINEIEELIEDNEMKNYSLMNSFFNILFWKNHSEGYLNINDKQNILKEIEKATKGEYLDTEKILPSINKIRKQIGLKELTLKLNNTLIEITPEVEKLLILKELE